MTEQLDNLNAFTVRESHSLEEARARIRREFADLLEKCKNGILNDDEYASLMKIKEDALEEFGVELGAYAKADVAPFRQGLKTIELFTKVSKFMEFGVNLREKATLGKLVLSDLELTNGTI